MDPINTCTVLSPQGFLLTSLSFFWIMQTASLYNKTMIVWWKVANVTQTYASLLGDPPLRPISYRVRTLNEGSFSLHTLKWEASLIKCAHPVTPVAREMPFSRRRAKRKNTSAYNFEAAFQTSYKADPAMFHYILMKVCFSSSGQHCRCQRIHLGR